MSYTIPPKPARSVQRRPPPGTDTRREKDHLYDQSSDDTIQDGSLPQLNPHSRRNHYASGYHVIAPDPVKNSKLKQMAGDEEEAHLQHQQHKRHLRTTHLSAPPKTLGGPILSTEEIDDMRAKQEREAQIEEKYSAIRQKVRREERKKEERRREAEKIEEHKRQQREKGERLERKKAVEEPIRQDEIRRARLAYFDKQ